MTTGPQPFFLFHIAKTGGSSVFFTFRSAVKPFQALHTDHCDKERLPGWVDHKLKSNILVLRGHCSPITLPLRSNVIRTVIVRDPIDRLISHFCYHYWQRYSSPDLFEFFRARQSYKEARFNTSDILKWAARFVVDNYQARMLANQFDGPVTNDTVIRAKDALRCCDLVGITEKLPLYMSALSRLSGLNPKKILFTNKASRKILDIDYEEIYQQLLPFVSFEAEIHAYAQESMETTCKDDSESISVAVEQDPTRNGSYLERFGTLLQSPNYLSQRLKDRSWTFVNRLRDYETYLK